MRIIRGQFETFMEKDSGHLEYTIFGYGALQIEKNMRRKMEPGGEQLKRLSTT